MKTLFILLSVIALVISSPVEETNDIKDYIEIIKCFLDQQPLIDDVNAIVERIKTQDFSQAITLLFKAYGDVQSAISQCIPQELKIKKMDCYMSCSREFNDKKREGGYLLEYLEQILEKCNKYCEQLDD